MPYQQDGAQTWNQDRGCLLRGRYVRSASQADGPGIFGRTCTRSKILSYGTPSARSRAIYKKLGHPSWVSFHPIVLTIFLLLRYGFLSENADFVELLESKDLTFVGPPASAIRKMGSKSESKKIMEQAGVPILQGYHGDEQSPEFLLQKSREIGFPVMLKASLGGGGKGMRIVHNEDEFME